MVAKDPVYAVALFMFFIGLAMAAPLIDASWLNLADFRPGTISIFQYSFIVAGVGHLLYTLWPGDE